MLMLMKLRTPACIVVGALCVLVSFVEPVRFLVWDTVIAAVTGAACITLLIVVVVVHLFFWFSGLRWRRPFAYDVPSRIATAEESGVQDALLRRYEQRAAERPGKLGDADRTAAAYIRRNSAALPLAVPVEEEQEADDYDDGSYYDEAELCYYDEAEL